MWPMKTSTIFKSRWMALLWAAGIIWMALDFAGTPSAADKQGASNQTDATGLDVNQKDMSRVVGAFGDNN